MSEFKNTTINTASSSNGTSGNNNTLATDSNYKLPSDITLKHACKLSIVEDKPILFDYWTNSLDKKALIGVKENGEKLLVKSEHEYTSSIAKVYKSGSEYI
jgi:hypothetical protein